MMQMSVRVNKIYLANNFRHYNDGQIFVICLPIEYAISLILFNLNQKTELVYLTDEKCIYVLHQVDLY